MPEVTLHAADAAELAEMLQFLSGWLARDPGRLAVSLEEFVGHPAYSIQDLRGDLERFAFLLGVMTASLCSASRRHNPAQPPGQPRIRRALPASTSFVLALRAAGAPR